MKQMGLSVSAISELTGYDRKTVRKYLLNPEGVPDYGPRVAEPSQLDAHKPYLADRLKAGVWNAQVLLREIRQRGHGGGYTILKDWLRVHDGKMNTAARSCNLPANGAAFPEVLEASAEPGAS